MCSWILKLCPDDAPPKSQSNRSNTRALLLPVSDGAGAERVAIRLARCESKMVVGLFSEFQEEGGGEHHHEFPKA